MSHPAIVPIQHENRETGEIEFDGTGFITVIEGQQVFVTCSHTFEERQNTLSYIIVADKKYELNGSNWCRTERPNEVTGFVDDENELACVINDYAFFTFPEGVIEEPLQLHETSHSLKSEVLILITFDLKKGTCNPAIKCKWQRFVAKSKFNSQTVKVSNMCQLSCEYATKGFSGSPVIIEGTD